MNEKPILFSDAMVRAILDGSKTQTRRVVKLPLIDRNSTGCEIAGNEVNSMLRQGHWNLCPYGKPGDQLWVRETWQYAGWTKDGEPYIGYKDGAVELSNTPLISGEWGERLADIWADLSVQENVNKHDGIAKDTRWRPSIHMPRFASRIDLLVTGVRVERLQAISEEDAIAEGVSYEMCKINDKGGYIHRRLGFHRLWESINGEGSWDENPWVWVIEFERKELGS